MSINSSEENFSNPLAIPSKEQFRFAEIISGSTGISKEKLINCFCRFGLDKVFCNPELLEISKDQQ